jgi:hypothetical protein
MRHARIVRNHWGVENNLHRTLDVSFGEDACQIRNKTCAKNMAILRRLMQTILSHDQRKKSAACKMLRFCCNPEFRSEILYSFARSITPKTITVATGRTSITPKM